MLRNFEKSLLIVQRRRSQSVKMNFSVEEDIRQKLMNVFKPSHLQVVNESKMHNVPKNSETHFKVVVVSAVFNSQSLIQRHRSVNSCLQDNLHNGVHALSITALTDEEWAKKDCKVAKSPPCQGGSAL